MSKTINYSNPNSTFLEYMVDFPDEQVEEEVEESVNNTENAADNASDNASENKSLNEGNGSAEEMDFYEMDIADAVIQLKKSGHAEFWDTYGGEKAKEVQKRVKEKYGKDVEYTIEDEYVTARVVDKPVAEEVANCVAVPVADEKEIAECDKADTTPVTEAAEEATEEDIEEVADEEAAELEDEDVLTVEDVINQLEEFGKEKSVTLNPITIDGKTYDIVMTFDAVDADNVAINITVEEAEEEDAGAVEEEAAE